jgi:hypothetical protein
MTNENNQIANIEPKQTVSVDRMPGAVAIRSRTGTICGYRLPFNGTKTAADLRAEFKGAGLKGKALSAKVNAMLRGTENVAWARHEVLVSSLRSGGYIPNVADCREKTAVLRFVHSGVTPAAEVTEDAALEALAKAKGMTVKDLQALLGTVKAPEGPATK